ncbi:apolipoprotein N-acyltransferase [Nostocoides australiense]|uniref:apolipoprotein N-acyltransferase n=1 Tax=Nostocoides australiense TaxID=99480 RepID=UPI00069FEAB1|nr:apolipoprotein N-acyltransferase [Tetrasphaera australiensis]
MSRDVPAPILPARLLLALAGGGAIALAFPDHNQWYAAWLGCGLIAAAGWVARWRTGFLVGLVAGLAYFVPTLSWSGVFVGKLPWIALATLEALYVAAMVAVIGPIQRRLVERRLGWAASATVPLGWVVGEWARSTTPFGGFPWARLAFSQADSPLRNLMSLGGAPLLTAAVATLGVLLYAVARAALATRSRALTSRRRVLTSSRRVLVPAVAAVALATLPLAIPLAGTSSTTARVAIVQGNVPKAGLDFNAERRAVLDNHVRGTEALAATAGALDLVIWPENAADIDPLRNTDAAAVITDARNAVKAPLLLGAILEEPAPLVSNASLLYRPGVLDPERYVKQHPVPFAEYVPYKDFFRRFNSNVDLVRDGMATGTQVGYFALRTRSGAPFAALPTICFEVAYDGLIRKAVTHSPQVPSVLVVQTNNATFGYTAESEQQFAISRLRAIEHNRPVAHVSTVGVSGFIRPDGSYADKSSLYTAYRAVADLPLGQGTTIADRLGRIPEYTALAGLSLAWGLGRGPRRRDNGPSTTRSSSAKEATRV